MLCYVMICDMYVVTRVVCIVLFSLTVLFFQTSLDVTETFKQQKVKLVTEGFNPDVSHDLLYFLDVSQKEYTLLTVSLYQDIVNGKIKV